MTRANRSTSLKIQALKIKQGKLQSAAKSEKLDTINEGQSDKSLNFGNDELYNFNPPDSFEEFEADLVENFKKNRVKMEEDQKARHDVIEKQIDHMFMQI